MGIVPQNRNFRGFIQNPGAAIGPVCSNRSASRTAEHHLKAPPPTPFRRQKWEGSCVGQFSIFPKTDDPPFTPTSRSDVNGGAILDTSISVTFRVYNKVQH